MKIQYKNKIKEIKEPMKISDLFKEEIEKSKYPVIAGKFNNEYENLDYKIEKDGKLELIDISSKEGQKVYRRTLIYIVGKAFEKLYPNERMEVNYQLANSMFCDFIGKEVTEEFVKKLTEEVKNIIKQNLPIKQVVMNMKEAKAFFEKEQTSKGRLQIDLEENNEIFMYFCEDYYNYCYGTLANRTGIVNVFEIVKYNDGFLIRYPSQKNPDVLPELVETKKLAWAMEEYDDIHKILNIERTYKINEAIKEKRVKDIIMLAEALHEKKIAKIADNIAQNKNIKMILIAGPSSSGKTTFAQRLGIQLRLNRIKPVTISVDNYFVERQETPRDANGDYDFECIEALDLDLFNSQLVDLLKGKEVKLPTFNFTTGSKEYRGNTLKLKEDEILVIEGIHCLNDKLTNLIPKENKFKVYISDLTVLNIDYYNRISTTDTRLIRRIVRDYKFRNYSAEHTLKTWYSVNRGEQKNIFPYQEEADCMFNSSIVYELAVLKKYAMPLLEEIPETSREYSEARRLITLLKYFKDMEPDLIPNNSLLREFIGGSIFEY